MSQTNNVNHVGGSVFIGSQVSGDLNQAIVTATSTREVLELAEELRHVIDLLPSGDSRVDLIDTNVRAIEESVRAAEPANAVKRLPALRKAAMEILDYSPRILDLVERIGRLLGV